MSDLLIRCSASDMSGPEAAAGPSWWARLARATMTEYRIRRAMREIRALDDRMLHDVGLDRGGVEYAARFGRD